MHLRTRSSQPGFMDARSKLVSRDVILPGCTEKLALHLVLSVNVMERNRNSYRNNLHPTVSYLEGPVS